MQHLTTQATSARQGWGHLVRAYASIARQLDTQLKAEHEGARIPHIVFTKGGGLWLEEMAAIGPDVLGLDWTVNLGAARARVGDRVALQGNLDPNVLFAPPERIEAEVVRALGSFGAPAAGSGHIFNLGHGISQYTPPDHVKKFSYKAGGGKIAPLFDGSEKVVSWDSFPWYIRTVSTP